MRFNELLAGSELEAGLRAEIDELLERKQRAGEAENGPRRPLLHAFIQSELLRGAIPPALPESRSGDVRGVGQIADDHGDGKLKWPGRNGGPFYSLLLEQIMMQLLHHFSASAPGTGKHRLWLDAP